MQVGSATSETGKSPPKIPTFFSPGQKSRIGWGQKIPGANADQPLNYWGSKACSGRVRAHLYSISKVPPNISYKDHLKKRPSFLSIKSFFKSFKVRLANFLFIKGTLILAGNHLLLIFCQPGVKGCLEAAAAGVQTLDPKMTTWPQRPHKYFSWTLRKLINRYLTFCF